MGRWSQPRRWRQTHRADAGRRPCLPRFVLGGRHRRRLQHGGVMSQRSSARRRRSRSAGSPALLRWPLSWFRGTRGRRVRSHAAMACRARVSGLRAARPTAMGVSVVMGASSPCFAPVSCTIATTRALTRVSYFTSLLRLNPSGLVPPCTGVDFAPPHQVVADLQEKRAADKHSSSSLFH
jgi:hypothetical protein